MPYSRRQCSRFPFPSMLRCKASLSTNTPTRLSWDSALVHQFHSHRTCSAPLFSLTGNSPTVFCCKSVLCCFCHLILHVLSLRSQQAFLQSSLSQQSMMLSGPSLHSYPGMQAPDLGKPQSSLAYQQPSSTQHIPILFEPQLNQPSGMGGSQLIDTHLLQVIRPHAANTLYHFQIFSNICLF